MPTWVVVLVLGWILFDAGFAAGAWWASRPREDEPSPRDALLDETRDQLRGAVHVRAKD